MLNIILNSTIKNWKLIYLFILFKTLSERPFVVEENKNFILFKIFIKLLLSLINKLNYEYKLFVLLIYVNILTVLLEGEKSFFYTCEKGIKPIKLQ